jgi:hypothetical protein
LAYEGLRKEGIEYALRTPRLKDQRKDGKLPPDLEEQWKKIQPFALGDPSQYGWNSPTDFGVYGSSHVGFLAAMVERTNVEMILQLDLPATEFFRPRAYPTFLYYNPYPEKKIVEIDLGPQPRDLYDAAADAFVLKAVAGKARFDIEPDRARVLVVAPAGGKLTRDGARTIIDGVVADYMSGH